MKLDAELIKNQLKDKSGKLSSAKTNESYIIKHFPDFHKYCLKLNQNYNFDFFSQLLYHVFNNIKDIPKCLICGEKVLYTNLSKGYLKYCGYSCTGKAGHLEKSANKRKQTNIVRGNAENPFCKNHSSYIIKQNNIKTKYNVDNVFQSEEIKEKCKITKLRKYKDPHYKNKEKAKETRKNRTKYQNEESRLKTRITKKEKYNDETFVNPKLGYETKRKRYGKKLKKIYNKVKITWSNKTPEEMNLIIEKGLKTSSKIKYYKNTKLYYQGSNELEFLKLCDSLNILNKITRGPTIKYKYLNLNKKYFPDFYYKDINLIIEVKSWYTYKIKKKINVAKQKATILNGYNYMFIIDNNFEEFIKMINI